VCVLKHEYAQPINKVLFGSAPGDAPRAVLLLCLTNGVRSVSSFRESRSLDKKSSSESKKVDLPRSSIWACGPSLNCPSSRCVRCGGQERESLSAKYQGGAKSYRGGVRIPEGHGESDCRGESES
jgi:hypothetical protein